MEMGDMAKDLPKDMQMKIIAMMPFPEIFKAMLLSRSWYARFRTLSEIADEEQQQLATFFQKQVLQRSKSWATFWPLRTTDVASPVAFNQAERKWQRLPSLHLPFLGENENLSSLKHLRNNFLADEEINLRLEGPLLYGIRQRHGLPSEIWVRNILTGKCKQLPPFPNMDGSNVRYMKLVIDSSAVTYQAVLICAAIDTQMNSEGEDRREYSACVYDSNTGSWSCRPFTHPIHANCKHSNFVYLNGICYAWFFIRSEYLLGFNVEKGTVETFALIVPDLDEDQWRFDEVQLVVFDGNLIVVVFNDLDDGIYIFMTDFTSPHVMDVASSQGDEVLDVINTHAKVNSLIRDVNNCLFLEISPYFRRYDLDGWLFLHKAGRRKIVVYNRLKNDWTFYEFRISGYLWTDCCFQPGLNPFVEV